MKSYLPLLFTFLFINNVASQAILSEDFEDYNHGDLITIVSENWSLWPRGTDATVTKEEASKGKKALKLEGGKGTDLYFPFNGRYTAGSIQFSMDMLIPKGSNGYFNLQGMELPGVVWSMQCYLEKNGYLKLMDDNTNKLQNMYPQDKWFKMSIHINFENHLWQFYIDDDCVGSYIQNEVTKQSIASLGLFPDGDQSLFYIDNLSFIHKGIVDQKKETEEIAIIEVLNLNADLGLTGSSTFVGINGSEQSIACLVKNVGQKTITNFELMLEINSESTNQQFQVNIPPGADTMVTIDKKIIYKDDQSSTLTLTTINGSKNDQSCNRSTPFILQGYTLHPDKKVWIEEATGTWCGWCPRGDVFMNYLSKKYKKHFVGIAVHQNDPMELKQWIGQFDSRRTKEDETITGLSTFIKGFPSAFVDRREAIDPAKLEMAFLESATKKPLAILSHDATWDENSRKLEISITTTIDNSVDAECKLIVGLTEDHIQGKGVDWSQLNYYSGNKKGPMGGYERLSVKVSDSIMVYHHVAKKLLTPFEGEVLTFKNSNKNTSTTRIYTHIIPEEWDLENMHIVSGLSIETSEIHNANKTSIFEAIENKRKRK